MVFHQKKQQLAFHTPDTRSIISTPLYVHLNSNELKQCFATEKTEPPANLTKNIKMAFSSGF